MATNPLQDQMFQTYLNQNQATINPTLAPGTIAGQIIGVVQYNDHGRVIESHGPFETVISVANNVQQTSLVDLTSILPFFVYVMQP